MDNWFKSKWFVRGVSLAFAILLYVFVNVEISAPQSELRFFGGAEEMETVEDVPVEIKIDSDNYVVRGVPEFATISFEGAKSVLMQTVQLKNFKVFVDLTGLEEGDHTVDLQYSNVPSELKVYLEPKTVDVTIEERASKEFDVTVDFLNTDQLPDGFELGKTEVNPETVTITSSKSVIEQIAIVKVFIDVSGITDPVNNREVPVNVYDSQGNELRVGIEPENVVVSVGVDNPSKTVPVDIATTGTLPDGYTLTSITSNMEDVEIFATSDILAEIDAISTEEIDLTDITESGKMDVDLALPDDVQVVGDDPVEVTIEIEQTTTFDDVPIDVENVQDGQEVTFIEPDDGVMSITVEGDQAVISELTADDFRLLLDASDLDAGEHQVPVTIEGPDDVTYTPEFDEVTIDIS